MTDRQHSRYNSLQTPETSSSQYLQVPQVQYGRRRRDSRTQPSKLSTSAPQRLQTQTLPVIQPQSSYPIPPPYLNIQAPQKATKIRKKVKRDDGQYTVRLPGTFPIEKPAPRQGWLKGPITKAKTLLHAPAYRKDPEKPDVGLDPVPASPMSVNKIRRPADHRKSQLSRPEAIRRLQEPQEPPSHLSYRRSHSPHSPASSSTPDSFDSRLTWPKDSEGRQDDRVDYSKPPEYLLPPSLKMPEPNFDDQTDVSHLAGTLKMPTPFY